MQVSRETFVQINTISALSESFFLLLYCCVSKLEIDRLPLLWLAYSLYMNFFPDLTSFWQWIDLMLHNQALLTLSPSFTYLRTSTIYFSRLTWKNALWWPFGMSTTISSLLSCYPVLLNLARTSKALHFIDCGETSSAHDAVVLVTR